MDVKTRKILNDEGNLISLNMLKITSQLKFFVKIEQTHIHAHTLTPYFICTAFKALKLINLQREKI